MRIFAIPSLLIIIVVGCLLALASSRLYVARIILVSEGLEISVKTKHRFTDVGVTSKTRAAILNASNFIQKSDIPNMPIRNDGRIPKKYHDLGNGKSVYIISEVFDQKQVRTVFQEQVFRQGSEHQFIVMHENSKRYLDERDRQNICWVDNTFNLVNITLNIIDSFANNCIVQLFQNESSKHTNQHLQQSVVTHQATEYVWTLAGCLLIPTFTFLKLYLIQRSTVRLSVV